MFEEDYKKIGDGTISSVYAILIVRIQEAGERNNFKFEHVIEELKECFINHVIDYSAILRILSKFDAKIDPMFLCYINGAKKYIEKVLIQSKKTDEALYENYFQRMLESLINIQLLLSPSKETMLSIYQVSQCIVALLNKNATGSSVSKFLIGLGPCFETGATGFRASQEAFGCFPETPTISQVINILEKNQDTIRILLIHDIFAYLAYRDLADARLLARQPTGFFSDYLKKYIKEKNINITPSTFLSSLSKKYRADIINNFLYGEDMFADRGRKEKWFFVHSTQFGIMQAHQSKIGLPYIPAHHSHQPDCLNILPDYKNSYVRDVFSCEIPYISGYSGMTTLYLGVMELAAVKKDIISKQYYLLGIMSYMVGGGLHTMHEVLTVAQVRLKLIPGYTVSGIGAGNYNTFFQIFYHDKRFIASVQEAWNKFSKHVLNILNGKTSKVEHRNYIFNSEIIKNRADDALDFLFQQIRGSSLSFCEHSVSAILDAKKNSNDSEAKFLANRGTFFQPVSDLNEVILEEPIPKKPKQSNSKKTVLTSPQQLSIPRAIVDEEDARTIVDTIREVNEKDVFPVGVDNDDTFLHQRFYFKNVLEFICNKMPEIVARLELGSKLCSFIPFFSRDLRKRNLEKRDFNLNRLKSNYANIVGTFGGRVIKTYELNSKISFFSFIGFHNVPLENKELLAEKLASLSIE